MRLERRDGPELAGRKFYLYNSGFVEDPIPGRLVTLHVPQDVPHTGVLRVDQTEGSDIDEIVLEVLEVERLDVLKNERIDRAFQPRTSAPGCLHFPPSLLTKVVKR